MRVICLIESQNNIVRVEDIRSLLMIIVKLLAWAQEVT